MSEQHDVRNFAAQDYITSDGSTALGSSDSFLLSASVLGLSTNMLDGSLMMATTKQILIPPTIPSSQGGAAPLLSAPADPPNGYYPGDSGYGFDPDTETGSQLAYLPDLGIAGVIPSGDSPGGDVAAAQLQAYSGAAPLPISELDFAGTGLDTWSQEFAYASSSAWYASIAGTLNSNTNGAFNQGVQETESWINFAKNALQNNLYDPSLVAQGWKEIYAGQSLACTAVHPALQVPLSAVSSPRPAKLLSTSSLLSQDR